MVDFEKIARKVLKERTDIQYIPDLAKPIAEAIVEAIEKAELERTNFEKLKDELTVEKYFSLIEKSCNEKCPLYWTDCRSAWIELYRKTANLSQIEGYCLKKFTEWANRRNDQ